MKKYLITYCTGDGMAKAALDTAIVETDDGYMPASDDCMLLKKLVCEKYAPKKTVFRKTSSLYNGQLMLTYGDTISPSELRILSVSNLNV